MSKGLKAMSSAGGSPWSSHVPWRVTVPPSVPARSGPAWRSWLLTVAVVLAVTTSFQLVAVPFVGNWPWPLRLVLSAVYVAFGDTLVVGAGVAALSPIFRPRGI